MKNSYPDAPRAVRSRRPAFVLGLAACLLWLSGCVTVDPQPSFDRVAATVAERNGQPIAWTVDEADRAAARAVLEQPLTLDNAVRLALISSPALQAEYQRLGIAEARLAQAGLMRNPVFDLSYREGHGENELELGVSADFLDVFLIPLRTRRAEADQRETELAVVRAVLHRIGQVRQAWTFAVAARHLLARERESQAVLESLDQLSEALRQAGNITHLDRERARLVAIESRLRIEQAEADAANAEDELAVVIGAWGEDIDWRLPDRLPRLPRTEPTQTAFEAEAVARSLELEIAREAIVAEAAGLQLADREFLIPSLELGWSAERDAGEWKNGPAAAFALPLLDTGRAANASRTARIEQLRREYLQLEIEIRAAARRAHRELQLRRGAVDHMVDSVLPLANSAQEEIVLHYNAMEVGIAGVLETRLEFSALGRRFVEVLAAYWQARERHAALLQGVLIDAPPMVARTDPAPETAERGGH